MGNLKSLPLLVLLFSLFLAVSADTSNDAATQTKDEMRPSDATDAVEPQQHGRGHGGCRYGCWGAFAHGQCSGCCRRPLDEEAEAEAKKVVEPQQRTVVVVGTNVAEPGVIDGATTVAEVKLRRRRRPRPLRPSLLRLSSGAVVVVGTNVAESGVMDAAATVAEAPA